MKRLWNMIRWGSEEGPEIFIDWGHNSITFLRCSDRLTSRYMKWVRTTTKIKSVTVIDENGVVTSRSVEQEK